MKTTMISRMIVIMILTAGLNAAFGADQNAPKGNKAAAPSKTAIKLPPQNSPEYWNVRTEAISELLPLLTQKRLEMKNTEQVLRDYLLDNNMGSDYTAKNVPVPSDPNVYFEILKVGQGLNDMGIPKPKSRPSWNELMEVAMEHVVYEGYMPTHVEKGEDLEQYTEMCRKKEEYGQKVRQDLRSYLDQCARMWVYLQSQNKLDAFKVYCADMVSQHQAQRAQAKAAYDSAHQQQMQSQDQQREAEKFQDAQAREQFASSRRQQTFESRQTRLNSRAANAGINIYGF